jgi:hypothetical protein
LSNWPNAEGYLTSFPILLIYAQFFHASMFRKLSTLQFHDVPKNKDFCRLCHVFGYTAVFGIQRLKVANEML